MQVHRGATDIKCTVLVKKYARNRLAVGEEKLRIFFTCNMTHLYRVYLLDWGSLQQSPNHVAGFRGQKEGRRERRKKGEKWEKNVRRSLEYELRPRSHDRELVPEVNSLIESNFLIRQLYKNCY